MNRILIVRLSALGDIVHAIPVLAAITRQWPAARVDWLVEHAYAPILSLVKGLHRRVVVRGPATAETADTISFGGLAAYASAASHLRAQQYDAALDLQGLIKSATWAHLGARRSSGSTRAPARALAGRLYSETVVPPERVHVIQKNLSLLKALGVDNGGLSCRSRRSRARPPLKRSPRSGRRQIRDPQSGAAWPNKRWPAERCAPCGCVVRGMGCGPS